MSVSQAHPTEGAGMYQCPRCHAGGISAKAVFSMGERILFRCQKCHASSYRKLSVAVQIFLTFVLTILGSAMILTKGDTLLFLAWLAGIAITIVLTNHLFGTMVHSNDLDKDK
jgi:hypothetical protein